MDIIKPVQPIIPEPIIAVIDGKRLQQISTTVQDEQTVVIPQQIIIPDQRLALPSGFLAQGDTVTLTLTVTDSDGNSKEIPSFEGFNVSLDDWPVADDQEILAVVNLCFTQSTKPISEPMPDIET